MKNFHEKLHHQKLKISLPQLLVLMLAIGAQQLASANSASNSTSSSAPGELQQDDLVVSKRPSSGGRAGRMLDLDVMAGELGKEAKAAQERLKSGDRQSRMLGVGGAAAAAGKVEGRSPGKKGGKKMSIKGFIPIITLDGKHNFEGLDGDADSSSSSNDENESEAAEQQQQQQQTNNLREHLATSYGGQTSIGHASFAQAQPATMSNNDWQQPTINNYNNQLADQMAQPSESGRATRKLLGSSGLLSGLTTLGSSSPAKRGLVSSLVPTAFGYQNQGGFSGYNQNQLGGPMNLPSAAAAASQQQVASSLPQSNEDCICVPFFQCKGGFLAESQLSKGQLVPTNHQIPRSLSDFSKPTSSSPSDPYYSPQQQGSDQQQQQQLVNEVIYEQLKKNLEGSNLEQQLQQQQAYQQANQQHLALLDERSNGANSGNVISSTNGNSTLEERSLLMPLASRRQQFQMPSSSNKCGIMRTCCRLPPRISSVRNQQQQQLIAQPFNQHPSRMGALSSAARFVQTAPSYPAAPMQLQQQPQQLIASPLIARPQTQYQMLQPMRQQQQQQTLAPPPQSVMQDFYNQQLASSIDAYPPMASQVAPAIQQQQQLTISSQQQRPPNSLAFMQGRCGQRQTLGISGRVQNAEAQQVGAETSADFGEFPAHAAILKRLSPGDSLFVCSAVLVSSQWLATAAHCVRKSRPDELKVRLGEWDVQRDDEFYPFFESNVREIHLHPDFQPSSLINDIALLRLEQAVDQQQMPHIAPACLPNELHETSFLAQQQQPQVPSASDFAGQRCWVAGWGKDAFGQQGAFQSVLKKVDLPVVGRAECEQALRYQTKLGKHFRLHASNICAGGERGKDACEGDGGAGLYCLEPASQLIRAVGLVSWGVGCGQRGVPGVYVSLAHFNSWIERVVASSGEENIYLDARANSASASGASNTGLDAQTFKSIISERSNMAPNNATTSSSEASSQEQTSNVEIETVEGRQTRPENTSDTLASTEASTTAVTSNTTTTIATP